MKYILKTKVRFLGISNVQYFLLSVESDAFTIQELSRKEACDYIEENNLPKVFSSPDGSIYTNNGKDLLSSPLLQQIYEKLDAI